MTGAEALQKILDSIEELKITVDDLKTSVKLIESNIKILNNRAAGLMRDGANHAQLPQTIQPSIQQMQAGLRGRQLTADAPNAQISAELPMVTEDRPGAMTYKKVFGRLIDGANSPIENVLVKVFDKNNEVCATAETDPVGYWESMLRPGRYVAEYTKQGFKTANKTFEVNKNAKEIEVK